MPDQPEVEVDWENWTPQMRSTLVFIRSEGKVLLIRKKRGLGEGKINGPGGKVEEGEEVEASAIRETQEEVGLTPLNPNAVAELYFQFADGLSIHCTVFLADDYEGELEETDEAVPMWVAIDEVPFDEMWQDDQHWLPQVLEGQVAEGYFTFSDDAMLSHHITFWSADGQELARVAPDDEPESIDEKEGDDDDAPTFDLDDEIFAQLQRIVESLVMASESPMSVNALLGTIRKVTRDHEAAVREAATAAQEQGHAYEDPGPDFSWVSKVNEDAIEAAVRALNESYVAAGRAFVVAERASGYKIFTHPSYSRWVRGLFPDQKPQRLSPPALETLAIIAYRQPLTKANIEAVRGVNVDGVIKMLLDRNLLQISGRADVPGRPLLYETTDLFLDHFGIRTVDDLPNAEELRQVKLPTADVPEEDDSGQSSEDDSEQSSEDISERSPEDISEQSPEDISEQSPEDISEQSSEDISEQSSGDNSEQSSEDNSEQQPEDAEVVEVDSATDSGDDAPGADVEVEKAATDA